MPNSPVDRPRPRPATTRQHRRGQAAGSAPTRRQRRPPASDRTGVNTILGWGAAILVSLVITFVFRSWSKSEDNTKIKQEMIEVVATFPNYADKRAYYHRLIDRHHATQFEASYVVGGRRRGNSFDTRRYVISMSRVMAETARGEGETEVSAYL